MLKIRCAIKKFYGSYQHSPATPYPMTSLDKTL
jgi:hypothetical protein